MTSSDVLDTCYNLQLKKSGEILLKDITELLKSIKKQALNINLLYVLVEAMEFMQNQLRLIKNVNFLSRIFKK